MEGNQERWGNKEHSSTTWQDMAINVRTGRSFRIFQLSLNTWLQRDRSYLTHDFVLLECYDLPPVDNGSVAFITYKHSRFNTEWSRRNTNNFSAIWTSLIHFCSLRASNWWTKAQLCLAIVFVKPPWLNEWLQYQKTIGIDHIHMIADNSFVKAGGFRNKYLKQAIREGFISTDVWHMWLNDSQI